MHCILTGVQTLYKSLEDHILCMVAICGLDVVVEMFCYMHRYVLYVLYPLLCNKLCSVTVCILIVYITTAVVYNIIISHSILEGIQLCIQLLIRDTYKLLSDWTVYSRTIARIGFLHVGI